MVRGELVGGRFYIERCVHRSASMAVYRALDSTDSAEVVVRVFPTLSTAGAQHLERVCAALWRHPHPGIERIVAWGRGSSGEGYTAALVPDGPSLEEAFTDGLRESDQHHVLRRVLEALGHMHELGLAHGNVSAEAIVLPRGVAGGSLLIDTTLIPPELLSAEASVPSVTLAPARHLAPERIRVGSGPSPAADIFSLGCTLYHALSGSLPFQSGTLIGIYLRVLYSDPKPLETVGRPSRSGLELLARRMLAKHPDTRPSAREALLELGALQAATGPTSAPTLPRSPHAAETRSRMALVLCRLHLQKAPSLDSEAELDQAERLLASVGGRLDRLVSGLLLIEITQHPMGDIIERAGRAALLLQSVLPLAAIVIAEATQGSAADLDTAETLLGAVRSGQISVQPELIPRLGRQFDVQLGKFAALMWEPEPETNPRPSSPARFDSEVTISDGAQITMEISVPDGVLTAPITAVPLEPLPTVEMDLGPLALTTLPNSDDANDKR